MTTCKQCREFEKCKDDAFINGTKFDHNESVKYCTGFEPITNADRIRAMSDEELAKLIVENAYTGACNDFGIPHQGQCCHNCEKCDAIINWLKQPAE